MMRCTCCLSTSKPLESPKPGGVDDGEEPISGQLNLVDSGIRCFAGHWITQSIFHTQIRHSALTKGVKFSCTQNSFVQNVVHTKAVGDEVQQRSLARARLPKQKDCVVAVPLKLGEEALARTHCYSPLGLCLLQKVLLAKGSRAARKQVKETTVN